jgi:hypothetical protein
MAYAIKQVKETAGPMEQGQVASLFDGSSCTRCGGLMVSTPCLDLSDDTGQFDFDAWRCIQCGDLVDSVILRNRQGQRPASAPPLSSRHQQPSRSQETVIQLGA